jgi:predicted small secreted protein
MNRINRKYIDRLKVKGAKWLQDNIAMEKRLLTSKSSEHVLYREGMREISADEESSYVLYIQAMEKALAELELSE